MRFLVVAALVGAPAEQPSLSEPDAIAAVARAKEAFAAGDYDAAATALQQAYEAEPDPKLLVAWAQAVRLGGDCPRALELYHEYLDGPRTQQEIEDTRKLMAECPEPEPAVITPPLGDPVDSDATEPAAEVEPEPQPEPVAPSGDPPEPRTDEPPRPWARDPAGLSLAISSGVVLATATGLLIGARVSAASADGAPDHTAFRDRIDRDIAMERASIGLYAGGGALAVGAAIAYGLAARRGRRHRAAVLLPIPGGLSISGRF